MAKKKMTYKEAMDELEVLTNKIETGEPAIDELAEDLKRIAYLVNLCKDKLRKTDAEVKKIFEEIDQSDL